jgi:hypothetical protein
MYSAQKSYKLPRAWGDDSLTSFIQTSYQNIMATFVHKREVFNLLLKIDGVFKCVCANLDDIEYPRLAAFISRSHSAFLASCRMSMSGQSTESFPQLRSGLEYSLYALHIYDNTDLMDIWLRRHESKKSLNEVRKQFSHAKVMKSLCAHDQAICEKVSELYERTIDFGGHPNQRAISSSTTMHRDGNGKQNSPIRGNQKGPTRRKNYLSFFSEILYDTPSREKTCA